MSTKHILSEIDAIFASTRQDELPISSSISQQKKKSSSQQPIGAELKANDKPNNSLTPNPNVNIKGKSKRKLISETTTTTVQDNDDQVVIDPSEEILKKSIPLNQKSQVQLTDDIAFQDSRGKRARTDDGLPIYSVEELKIGLGGDTDECPFDCQCCF